MEQHLRRRWKFLTARRPGRSAATADPKVELERAIGESENRHRRLRGQAALVIANHKLTEARLDRAIEELERVDSSARQALMAEIDALMSLHLQASEAADQAKTAVAQSSAALQQALGERLELLGQLDRSKMQPRIDEAMETLSEGIGHDVPSFDEVRERIEARYVQAKAVAELVEGEQPA